MGLLIHLPLYLLFAKIRPVYRDLLEGCRPQGEVSLLLFTPKEGDYTNLEQADSFFNLKISITSLTISTKSRSENLLLNSFMFLLDWILGWTCIRSK